MRPLLRAEWFKLTHRRLHRVLLAVMGFGLIATYLSLGAVVESNDGIDDLRLDLVPTEGMFLVYQIGVLMTVIVASSSIASEFSWGTIRTIVPRGSGRGAFLGAKLVSLATFVVVVTLLGFAGAMVGSALVTALEDLDGALGNGFAGRALGSLAGTAFTMLPYGSLAFALALWFRSNAVGIAVPIIIFYAEVLLTPAFTSSDSLAWLPNALIYTNITAVIEANPVVDEADLPERWQAVLVLASYVTAFLTVGVWRFRTRDIT